MIKFFTVLTIFIIACFFIVFKRKNLIRDINIKNFYSSKSLKRKKNTIKSISQKNSFNYKNEPQSYSDFYKKYLIKKMFKLFQSHTEDKLKALEIAEDLGDKSTLPILRRGLKDMSPLVIERSAMLIRKFK
tara:strand:+ start:403 stop:795 length:393 start_codon:yes stop_codon:yes gene_type:complete